MNVKCNTYDELLQLVKHLDKQGFCNSLGNYVDRIYNVPMYADTEGKNHQGIGDDNNWPHKKWEDEYNKAAPLDALLHPDDYPEYHI